MALTINRITILGHVGQDPKELRFTARGHAVMEFDVATTERRGTADEVTWHKVRAYGKLAEKMHSLVKKGEEVFVDGKITHSKWTDKATGQIKKETVIDADTMRLTQKARLAPFEETTDHVVMQKQFAKDQEFLS